MTTTISFPTRDCIVIGCDSLATTSEPMIDPFAFVDKFLDKNLNLRLDSSGKPVLKNFNDMLDVIERVPTNQMPNVTKLFHLKPAPIGILHAGVSIIGNKSIKNIVEEFLSKSEIKKYLKGNYTVYGVTTRLHTHFKNIYDKAFEPPFKPAVEIIVSGYSKRAWQPEIRRIELGNESKISSEVKKGEYRIVFGGQHDVIERVVKGIDYDSFRRLNYKFEQIKLKYHELLTEFLKKKKINVTLPKPTDFQDELQLIKRNQWLFNSISASDLKNFSDQAAIDFVYFLVNIMIKTQQFNNKLPTVGGDIHLAIINKVDGFIWISKEEYKFKDYGVPKHAKRTD